MGFFNWGKKNVSTEVKNSWLQIDETGQFYHYIKNALSANKLERFDSSRALHFATHIAEIFTPIDIISERVASCDYQIFNKNTNEPVEKLPERLQFLIDKPNPMHSGTELIYQIQFSELASGASYTLTKQPDSIKGKSYDTISNIWCLNPDRTKPILFRSIPNPFLIKDLSELIEKYETHWLVDLKLLPKEIYFNTVTKLGEGLEPSSPLLAVTKNINNLLAVYSARFNVYEKNGVSGIVFKDNKGANSISEQVNATTRQDILDDIQKREGITGDRNFTGISSFPLGFINTLGKIKDLEPFRETEADAIAIGAIYNVDKELIPREGSSTFTNKQDTEKHLWQNTIKPYAEEMAKTLTKVYYLPEEWEFRASVENVDILQADRKTQLEADTIEIDNIVKLKELGVNIGNKLEKWKD